MHDHKIIFSHYSCLIFLAIFLATIFLSSTAYSAVRGAVGAGILIKTNIRENSTLDTLFDIKRHRKSIVMGIPVLSINIGRFALGANGASFSLLRGPIGFSLKFDYGGHGYRADNMQTRHSTLWGGVGLRILFLNLSALTDLFDNRSHGLKFRASIRKRFKLNSILMININGGVEYFDHKYVEYYFGVKESEETTTRSAYKGEGSYNYFISSGPVISITDDLKFNITGSYKIYGDSIKYSPTVRTNYEKTLMAMLMLSF